MSRRYSAPAPSPLGQGSGLPSWALVLAGIAGALVLAADLALPLRLRERGDPAKPA